MFEVKRTEMVNKTFRMSVDLVSQCCEYALDNMETNKKVSRNNKK